MTSRLNREDYVKAVNFTFDHFDKNKTGRIDKAKFVDMVGAVSQKLNFPVTDEVISNAFRRLDRNGQGTISSADLHGVLERYYFQ